MKFTDIDWAATFQDWSIAELTMLITCASRAKDQKMSSVIWRKTK
jgi:hypothetical protein